ncbi:YraN family protein [Cochlodiniinecator piscidefendens]|uniref:YraN family protein n=1 Tax=Cochlodiniinecator piscidefendens TaxID=2715756 RepID=UPI00140CF031|nr:YraN family protein [Cochlodiniinecator piscidefendens]
MSGKTSYLSGLAAEEAVTRLYVDQGFMLRAERWRGAGGEIDLIFQKGDEIVFVEVKKSKSFEQAAAALSAHQIGRIYASAEEFIGSEPLGLATPMRFDAALVDVHGQVQILENAFGLG